MGNENENLAWTMVDCKHIVDNEYIDFRECRYRFPDGTEFGPYYNYSRRDYVVIVATDADGNYICVRQYRHGIERVTTEFCAGGIERCDGKEYGQASDKDNAEAALDAAKRELLEETGYESDDWHFLMSIPSNATMADNYANIFVARNCCKTSGQNLDDTEYLNVKICTRKEIDDMIASGEFPQMAHVMALLLADKNCQ
ncbi:MAG: NUDIX hydrolase [Pseudobutyrivibrio sp.]|nr:NUDIX hydrolase [Pseudobutyrivibrio sp.]